MNRRKAIRKRCLDCAGSLVEVKDCELINCPLYKFRLAKIKKDIKTENRVEKLRNRAIKKYCIECSGGSKKNCELCEQTDCTLYPFR